MKQFEQFEKCIECPVKMRKYRLSTKYRGEKADLADHVGLSSINHYGNHLQNGGNKLNCSLNKVYIRNFYEYHHRKRPGEGVSASPTEAELNSVWRGYFCVLILTSDLPENRQTRI